MVKCRTGIYNIFSNRKETIVGISTILYCIMRGTTAENYTSGGTISTAQKVYDETTDTTVTAEVNADSLCDSGDVVKATVTASFKTADSGDDKEADWEITSIYGKNADKYVLADEVKGTTQNNKIDKATVTVICSETTTRTFDGNAQEVDVSAMANGKVFDKSNYTVKYNGGEAPSAVGSYPITIELETEAAKELHGNTAERNT